MVYKALGLFKGEEEPACLLETSSDMPAVALKLMRSGWDCEVCKALGRGPESSEGGEITSGLKGETL